MKTISSWVIGITIFIGFILLVAMLLNGASWALETFSGVIEAIHNVTFLLIVLLIVVSIIPKIRAYTGWGINALADVSLALLWFTALVITYELWGLLGVIVGFFFFGVGVFLAAMIAMSLAGGIAAAGLMLASIVLLLLMKVLGVWIMSKHKYDEDSSRSQVEQLPSSAPEVEGNNRIKEYGNES